MIKLEKTRGALVKRFILFALLLVPIFVALQTVHRFIFWEAVDGRLIQKLSNGSGSKSSRSFVVEFKVDQKRYQTQSSIGTNATSSSFSDKSKIGVLFDPDDPKNSVIKYHHGQLEKLIFFSILCGGFWFVLRIFFKNMDKKSVFLTSKKS